MEGRRLNQEPEVLQLCEHLMNGPRPYQDVADFFALGPTVIDIHSNSKKATRKALENLEAVDIVRKAWAVSVKYGGIAGIGYFLWLRGRRYFNKKHEQPRMPRRKR